MEEGYLVILHRLDGEPINKRTKISRKLGKTKSERPIVGSSIIIFYNEERPGNSPGVRIWINEVEKEGSNYWKFKSYSDHQYALIYL